MQALILNTGDVIAVDPSWEIVGYEVARRVLILNQKKAFLNLGEGLTVDVPDYTGPHIANVKLSQDNFTLKDQVEADNLVLSPGQRFLVIKTEKTGGGTGHSAHDVYPDGHYVTAIKLSEGDVFDPNEVRVQFFQTGAFTCMIKKPFRVGTMQQSWGGFTRVDVP